MHYLLGKPYRLTNLGKVIAHVGLFFSLAGLFGRLGVLLISTFTHEEPKQLAQLYPQLPVWWVPESMFTGVLSALILAAGVYIVIVGRAVDRRFNAA